MIPAALIAITLPPLEIILGTAILIRFLYHGALFTHPNTCIFIASLVSLLARNIDINCGCLDGTQCSNSNFN